MERFSEFRKNLTNFKGWFYTNNDRVNDNNIVSISLDSGMASVRDKDIKKLSITKQEFVSALKKVSQRIEKPKSSSK